MLVTMKICKGRLIIGLGLNASCDADETVVGSVDGPTTRKMVMNPLGSVEKGKVDEMVEDVLETRCERYFEGPTTEFPELVEADEALRCPELTLGSSERGGKVVLASGTTEKPGKIVDIWGRKGEFDNVSLPTGTVATGLARLSLLMSVQSQSLQQ